MGNESTPAASTAIAAGPPLGSPSANAVPPPPTPAALPQIIQAWPRSAQLTTAILLAVAVVLLIIHSQDYLRHGSRPLELERGAVVTYRVDLNHAQRAELLQLPGIGNSMAQRIEDYRETYGGFRSVEELTRIPGFGPATLERLRPWVTVENEQVTSSSLSEALATHSTGAGRAGTSKVAIPSPGKNKKVAALAGKIDVNRASAEDLRLLPGIGPKMSQRIVDEREKRPFKSVEELRRVAGIGPKTLERLRPFVTVPGEPVRTVAAE
jgi:competence protein ComEA